MVVSGAALLLGDGTMNSALYSWRRMSVYQFVPEAQAHLGYAAGQWTKKFQKQNQN